MTSIKIIVEKGPDGYVAYPLGVTGAVVGQGDSYEAALADVRSAIEFHVQSFGADVLSSDSPVLEAFVAEAVVEDDFDRALTGADPYPHLS
ncbi:MAG TPA: hypothetical protein PK838_08100 [Thermoleophilia bacterium]|nr:hypothetical protein [Thermoleophilia bacterium]